MALRSTWKGHLKISLVTVPVRVYPATDPAATLSFHQLHGTCQTRIQQKRWCPSCEREVAYNELVKGYEFEKGRYVVVDEEDLGKVRVESTRVINLVQFADEKTIDPIYFEKPYYLAPDGDVAAGDYAVVREGIRGKAGIGKLALYGREYLVAVRARDRGLIMYTLRHAAEIRHMDAIDELDKVPATVSGDEVKLARRVIGAFAGKLDLSAFRDEYQEELRRIIDQKIAGEEIVAPEAEAPAKVVNLMDALRKSLHDASGAKKKTAKAALPSRTPARAAPRPAAKKRARG